MNELLILIAVASACKKIIISGSDNQPSTSSTNVTVGPYVCLWQRRTFSVTRRLYVFVWKISFYRPTPDRHKVLMEHQAFPSDYVSVYTFIQTI